MSLGCGFFPSQNLILRTITGGRSRAGAHFNENYSGARGKRMKVKILLVFEILWNLNRVACCGFLDMGCTR
ncbi:hypothetical protein H6P81_002304 [Aristolochia fimbriata]|uniref:Uncharacterized protein n=1 Tax=Aristolochia fimbriata TaxID=158543 RepID=A0AAV7FCM2_ARIFI|nr:hypothetical protein H6P81_002304 [Aristolochia fimbriata]